MVVEAPARIGELDVVRRIGAGGFGVVYLANDRRLGRKVALKLAHPGRGDLLREARAAARLAHPNVVTIFEIGDHDGSPYLVMEYVDGPTLRDRLDGDRLPLADALRIARDIAAATAAAHKEGIIHADLTPANVLLASDGRARVVDFGLARGGETIDIASVGPVVNPQHSIAAGTPTYMSPEAWRMERLGPPADVWALGAMTHVLVTGEPPVDGASEILRERVAGAAALELSPALAAVPQDLAALVRRCLAKDPAARPSAADVASELDKLLGRIDGALQPFRPHAIHNVGRDEVVANIAALVRAERIVTITAPAEAGKSCAVHAAAVALRADGWRVAIARPSLSAIAGALRSIGSGAVVATMDADAVAPDDEATRWTRSPDRFAADLDDGARAAGKLALVLDPVLDVDAPTTAALAAAVADDGAAHLVFVARDVAAVQRFGDAGQVHALPTPTREELQTMLERPISDAGYRFEDGLVDELVSRALREPAPALWVQKTGAALWEARDRDARVLERAALPEPPHRRRRWLAAGVLVLVIAAAGVGAYALRTKPARAVAAGPQCAPFFFPNREIVPWFNAQGLQDALAGVSSDGRSVLTHRRNCMPNPDLPVGWSTLLIENLDGEPATIDVSGLDGMVPDDGRATMTGDALTIMAVDRTNSKLLAWSRSKRGIDDFKPRDPAELAAITVQPPVQLAHPIISQDGLELFATLRNESKERPYWIYHSERARVGDPFPPLTAMPPDFLNIAYVSGISADRRTLFVGSDYGVVAFTRAHLNDTFKNPNAPTSAPTFPGFRTRPIGDCTQLLGTCTGGCNNEETCLFSR